MDLGETPSKARKRAISAVVGVGGGISTGRKVIGRLVGVLSVWYVGGILKAVEREERKVGKDRGQHLFYVSFCYCVFYFYISQCANFYFFSPHQSDRLPLFSPIVDIGFPP